MSYAGSAVNRTIFSRARVYVWSGVLLTSVPFADAVAPLPPNGVRSSGNTFESYVLGAGRNDYARSAIAGLFDKARAWMLFFELMLDPRRLSYCVRSGCPFHFSLAGRPVRFLFHGETVCALQILNRNFAARGTF